jgi:hypothetical protein
MQKLSTTTIGFVFVLLWAMPKAQAQFSGAWSEPINLGRSINSDATDQHPSLSKDGLSLYFVSNRAGGLGNLDIYVSQRGSMDEPWGPPVNLGMNVNSLDMENAPSLSHDGHRLFFGSNRPGGCGGFDIWVAFRQRTRDDFDWQTPVNLGCAINTLFDEDGPTYFEDETLGVATLYFTSLNRPGSIGDWDIYESSRNADGSFGRGYLVLELSGAGRDTRTSISRDGRAIYITSNRAGGLGGLDIWGATRASTSELWSRPENLDAPVNTPANDGAPALSFNGSQMFFYSTRPGGLAGNDLYTTNRAKHRSQSSAADQYERLLAESVRSNVDEYLRRQTQKDIEAVGADIARTIRKGVSRGQVKPATASHVAAIIARLQKSPRAPKNVELVGYHNRPGERWAGMRYGNTVLYEIGTIEGVLERHREDLAAAILAHELGHDASDAIRNLLAESADVSARVKAIYRALVEEVADQKAVAILSDAGYSPDALVEYLRATSQFNLEPEINRTYRIEPTARFVAFIGPLGSR